MRLSVTRCLGFAISTVLLVFLIPATSHAATFDPGSSGYPALTTQAVRVHNSSNASSSTGSLAAAPGQNPASCVRGTCTLALNHAETQALIALIDGTPKLQLLTALYTFCTYYTFGSVPIRTACTVFAAAIVFVDGPGLAHQLSDEDRGFGVHITFSITDYKKIGITPQSAPVPHITHVTSYTEGVFAYFKITYADPGHDAEGFGFVGVNGSGWAEENHPFSSPSYGIVGPNSIAYPFNQGCGTAQQYDSYVEAWIYNNAGVRSQPVTIHLVCTSTGTAG
jgi:hypothetical protein